VSPYAYQPDIPLLLAEQAGQGRVSRIARVLGGPIIAGGRKLDAGLYMVDRSSLSAESGIEIRSAGQGRPRSLRRASGVVRIAIMPIHSPPPDQGPRLAGSLRSTPALPPTRPAAAETTDRGRKRRGSSEIPVDNLISKHHNMIYERDQGSRAVYFFRA
jgi:hypothetical protein